MDPFAQPDPAERSVSNPTVAGQRYIVSMFGTISDWVHNLEATKGDFVIAHGGSERVRLVLVPPQERAHPSRIRARRVERAHALPRWSMPQAALCLAICTRYEGRHSWYRRGIESGGWPPNALLRAGVAFDHPDRRSSAEPFLDDTA